jgi:hypothetical protein
VKIFYRGDFIEEFEKCKRRLWKRTSLSIGSPSGEPGAGLILPGTLRDRWRALEMECLSLSVWKLCEGNLEGGLRYWKL